MSNLESARNGWIIRGAGVFFALLAIGFTVMDFVTGSWAWPINLITLACGFVNWHLGTKMIRQTRAHRQFMERHRAEIARLRGDLP